MKRKAFYRYPNMYDENGNELETWYWWGVFYPENMIEDWQTKIYDLLGLPFAYCIHDKDVCTELGLTKVHVHIMIAFPNNTKYHIAADRFETLNAPGKRCFSWISPCNNFTNCFNYLIHDTEGCRKEGKLLYPENERIEGNNFDRLRYSKIAQYQKIEILQIITDYIFDNNIMNFNDVYAFCKTQINSAVYYEVLRLNSAFIDRLISGTYKRQKFKKEALYDSLIEKHRTITDISSIHSYIDSLSEEEYNKLLSKAKAKLYKDKVV